MDFATFTRTYKDKLKVDGKPYTFPQDTMLVAAQTGLSADEINAYVDAWRAIQEIYVRNRNQMPSVEEMIHEYNVAHGVAEPVLAPPPVPVVVPDRTPEAAKRSSFYNAVQRTAADPEDALIGSLSVRAFRALMDEVLDAAIGQAPAEDPNAAMKAKLEAALAALK